MANEKTRRHRPTSTVELGEEVTDQMEIGKPAGTVVSVRLEPALAQLLFDRAEADETRVSRVLRDALIEYLGVPSRRTAHIVPTAIQVSMAGTQLVTGLFNVRPGLITTGNARELELSTSERQLWLMEENIDARTEDR